MDEKVTSLYIHIPFCVSKCSYCDFFSIPTNTRQNCIPDDYINAVCNELKYRIKLLDVSKIQTVYIGGGTPSLLTSSQISRLCNEIKKSGLTGDYEFTFEVNPDDVNEDLLHCLDQNGINRISCGIQSFSESVLKCVHRRADSVQNRDCFKLFEQFWNKKLSVDLICGLPGETENSMLEGLEFVVNQNIPHISFYSLCVEEETPLGAAINNNTQNYDQDFADELWIKGRDFLLSHGYVQYEVSNFCLPGYECIHNMTYWTHKSYIGCGSGATGTIYNQDEDLRYTNTKSINKYIDSWNKVLKMPQNVPQTVEKISHKTSVFEYFMMGLRTSRGVSPKEYEELFNEKIPVLILKKLQSKCRKSSQGYYYFDSNQLLFLNTFLEDLFDCI